MELHLLNSILFIVNTFGLPFGLLPAAGSGSGHQWRYSTDGSQLCQLHVRKAGLWRWTTAVGQGTRLLTGHGQRLEGGLGQLCTHRRHLQQLLSGQKLLFLHGRLQAGDGACLDLHLTHLGQLIVAWGDRKRRSRHHPRRGLRGHPLGHGVEQGLLDLEGELDGPLLLELLQLLDVSHPLLWGKLQKLLLVQ